MNITYDCDLWNKIMEWRILTGSANKKDKRYTFKIDYEGDVSSYLNDVYLDEANIANILTQLTLENKKSELVMKIEKHIPFWYKLMEFRNFKKLPYAFDDNVDFEITKKGYVISYYNKIYLDTNNIVDIMNFIEKYRVNRTIDEIIENDKKENENAPSILEETSSTKEKPKLNITTLCKNIEDYTNRIFERYDAFNEQTMTYDSRDANLDFELADCIYALLEKLEEAKLYQKPEEIE